MSSRFKAYFMLLIVAAIWGIAGPIIKYTLAGLSPEVFLLYRLFISSVAGVTILLFNGLKIRLRKDILLNIFAYSFLTSTASLGLLFLGLNKTTVLDMSLINVFSPLLVSLLGYWFFKEHITKKEKIGILITFCGSLIILLDPLFKAGGKLLFGQLTGNVLILASVITSSASVIFLKKLLRQNVSPLSLSNIAFVVGFLTLAPLILYLQGPGSILKQITNLTPAYHLSVFYMALISGTFAYTLGNKAQRTIEVSEAALFTYLQPLFAVPLAVIWLKERPSLLFIFGSIIIASGVVIAETKRKLSRLQKPLL